MCVCVCECVLLCITPLSSSCSVSSRGEGGTPQDVFAWITNELFALSPDRQKNADFVDDRYVMCVCVHL